MGEPKRTAALEQVDGEWCYRVPLGKTKKHGTCIVSREDWDWYRGKGFSTTVRQSGGNVMVTVGDSNYTVARIIAGATAGERVKFVNDNKRDLRRANLLLVKGKGGQTIVKPPLEIAERNKIWPEQADFYDYSYSGLVRTPVRNARTGKRKDTFSGKDAEDNLGGERRYLERGRRAVGGIGGWIADAYNPALRKGPEYGMSLREQRKKFPGQKRVKRFGPNAAVAIPIEIEDYEPEGE